MPTPADTTRPDTTQPDARRRSRRWRVRNRSRRWTTRAAGAPTRGQALVEFSLAVVPFLMIVMAIVDLSRGVYQLNGTAEAAREIARMTALHTDGAYLGASVQSAEVIAVQRSLVPGLVLNPSTDIVCVGVDDAIKRDPTCRPGDYVRVTLISRFQPATPLVMMFGAHDFASTARAQIP